ncbi:MAG: hypothetical protein K8U57_13140 [Planctomycetes bacterium]|nr:hypothetical protein [Planctomycetota bacterium]
MIAVNGEAVRRLRERFKFNGVVRGMLLLRPDMISFRVQGPNSTPSSPNTYRLAAEDVERVRQCGVLPFEEYESDAPQVEWITSYYESRGLIPGVMYFVPGCTFEPLPVGGILVDCRLSGQIL